MRILNLRAENIKKLTAIDITPTSDMVMITGANGAGKSSVLDTITMALLGGKAIPSIPIKKGQERGNIRMDLGDYVITRSFTQGNSYLKIESADGKKVESPQGFLDKIVGNVSFDPLDFINNHSPAEQRNILLRLIGCDIDSLDKEEKDLRLQRTETGREVKRMEGIYNGIESYKETTATKEINSLELSAALMDNISYNVSWDKKFAENEQHKINAKNNRERIKQIEIEIEQLQKEREMREREIIVSKEAYLATIEKLSERPKKDITGLQEQLENLSEINRKIRANNDKKRIKNELEKIRDIYESFTEKLQAIWSKRKSLLKKSAIPVTGLSIGDTGLLYNGIPLEQASDGEKLMVSLGISMALNPTLRVLRIKDGSLLDEKNRQIIKDAIKEKDFQCWYESVSSTGGVGIYIEEGKIMSVDGVEVNSKKGKTDEAEINTPLDTASVVPSDDTTQDDTTPIDDGWPA